MQKKESRLNLILLYCAIALTAIVIIYPLSVIGNDSLWAVASVTTALFIKGLLVDVLSH